LRPIVLLTSVVVLLDTLFFAALTPLLPHYAHELGLSKLHAGVLAGAYPAGALAGAIPSGVVASRLGVKPTVIVGLVVVAVCTMIFGLATSEWALDAARFFQGVASAFTWTGALAWLVAAAPADRRGRVIGQAFAAAVAGALFGPVVGGVASVAGTGWTFSAVAVLEVAIIIWAFATPAMRPERPQGLDALVRALRDRRILGAFWLVVLPSLLVGNLDVLAPLRLSVLGLGTVGIGAVFLVAAAAEAVNNAFLGRISDRRGTRSPLLAGLAGSVVVAAVVPWPADRYTLAALVVLAGVVFGTFYTPGMTLLTNLSEEVGLDYGYAFALINLAWAPGFAIGAAGGASLAGATRDAVPYLALCGLCAVTLLTTYRARSPV
jgi:MFS family permease